jgi:magnesium-transporting ATPase (P-type)
MSPAQWIREQPQPLTRKLLRRFSSASTAASGRASTTPTSGAVASSTARTDCRRRARPAWRILLDQFASLIILLLLAAAVAAALFGRYVEAIAIGAAVLVNTVIGFTMELRATRAMEALQRMGKTQARVRRGGKEKRIAAAALVPGDIVLLEAGDMISADLRLLEANRLQVDEAALTGESVPVTKRTGTLDRNDPRWACARTWPTRAPR